MDVRAVNQARKCLIYSEAKADICPFFIFQQALGV